MDTMEVAYEIIPDKIISMKRDYFRNHKQGRLHMQLLLSASLWFLIVFFILFSVIIGSIFGQTSGIIFYIVCGIIYLFLGGKLFSKWWAKQYFKDRSKGHNKSNVCVLLTPDHVCKKSEGYETHTWWSEIEDVLKQEQWIRFQSRKEPFAVPYYAFDSRDQYDDFYALAKRYCDEHPCTEDDPKSNMPRKGWRIASLFLYLVIGLFIIVPATESRPPRLSRYNEAAKEIMIFWKGVFQEDFSSSRYSLDTTDRFKERYSEEQWEEMLGELREQVGILRKIEILSLNTRSDTTKTILKVTGAKGDLFVRAFFHDRNWWELNGFDVIEVEVKTKTIDSYSTPEDRRLFPDDQIELEMHRL